MPRFYFNVRTARDFVEDLEGVELLDLAMAVREAIEDARAAMATAILTGHDISRTSTIEIRGEDGATLREVPFRDAILDVP